MFELDWTMNAKSLHNY